MNQLLYELSATAILLSSYYYYRGAWQAIQSMGLQELDTT